jgi:hypothetical protein
MEEFDGRASDKSICEPGGEDAVYQIRKWTNPVHENPKTRQRRGTGKHTAENQAQSEEHICKVAASISSIDTCDNHICERGSEDEKDPDKEEEKPATLGGLASGFSIPLHADRIIEANEDND